MGYQEVLVSEQRVIEMNNLRNKWSEERNMKPQGNRLNNTTKGVSSMIAWKGEAIRLLGSSLH